MKLNKRFKSTLLSLICVAMMVAYVPTRVWAEPTPTASPEPTSTPVTEQQVFNELQDAKGASHKVEVEAIPGEIATGNWDASIDSAVAATNAHLAGGKVLDAQNIVDKSEKDQQKTLDDVKDKSDEVSNGADYIEDKKDEAEDNADAAAENAAKAKEDADHAEGTDLPKAQEERDATFATDSIPEAFDHAGKAQDAADHAQGEATDAKNVANNAQVEADAAQKAYEDAEKKYNDSDQAYKDAAKEYEDAVVAYNKACEDRDKVLATGIGNEEEAVKAAEDAKAAADAYLARKEAIYEQYKKDAEEKQKAYDAARDAKDKADKEVAAQKEAVAAARDNVIDKAENLLDTAFNSEEVKELGADGIAVVTTGAVLAVAEVATEIADRVVDKYEGDLADLIAERDALQAELDQLSADKAAAEQALKDAEEEYKKVADENGDPAGIYKDNIDKAKEALAAAEGAEKAAQEVLNKSAAVIAARDAYEKKADMENYQASIKEDPTDMDSVKALTELVINYESGKNYTYTWDTVDGKDTTYDTVTITDVENSNTYIVIVDENGVVQYHNICTDVVAEPKEITDINDLVIGKTADFNKKYEVVEGDEKLSIVVIDNTPCVAGGLPQEIKQDENGFYYETKKYVKTGTFSGHWETIRHNVTITDVLNTNTYAKAEGAETNSNSVTDKWAEAAAAEATLQEKQQAVADAKKAKTDAEDAAAQAKKDADDLVKASQSVLDGLVNDTRPGELTEDIAELEEQIRNLDTKLNGNGADQLARGLLTGEYEEQIDAAFYEKYPTWDEDYAKAGVIKKGAMLAKAEAEKLAISIGILNEMFKDDDIKATDVPGLVKDAKDTIEDINKILTGDNTIDKAEAIVDLLQSDVISIKTKQAILNKLEDLAKGAHEDALEKAKESGEEYLNELKKAGEELVEAGKNLGDSIDDLKDAQVAQVKAGIEEFNAYTAAAAASLLEAAAQETVFYAQQVQKDAQDALEIHEAALADMNALKEQGINDDRLKAAEELVKETKKELDEAYKNLDDAKAAMMDAIKSAKDAKDDADRAQAAADKAQKLADEALAEANRKAAPTPVGPTPGPVTPDTPIYEEEVDPAVGPAAPAGGAGAVVVANDATPGAPVDGEIVEEDVEEIIEVVEDLQPAQPIFVEKTGMNWPWWLLLLLLIPVCYYIYKKSTKDEEEA